MESQVKQ